MFEMIGKSTDTHLRKSCMSEPWKKESPTVNKPLLSPRRTLPLVALALCLLPAAAFAAPPAFQSAVTANSPYLYYRLGESSGTTAADSSGNSRDGTYLNSPTLGVPGALSGDTAATFSASSQQAVTTANAAGFGSLMGNASWEFLFKTTDTATQMALGGSENTGSVTGWEATLNRNAAGSATVAPDSIRFFLRDNNNQNIAAAFTSTTAFDGNYHDLVFTYDKSGTSAATRFLAYVDGVQQTLTFSGTGSSGSGTPATFSDLAFNNTFAARQNRAATDFYLNGTLDEVALYTSTLSAADVAAHAATLAAAAPIPEPASLSLLALGAAALVSRRRRTR